MNKQTIYWIVAVLAVVALWFVVSHVYASDFSDTVVPVSTGDRTTIQAEGEKAMHEAYARRLLFGRDPPASAPR